jgi:glycosyltransferase involved in cell wall biosynthesis
MRRWLFDEARAGRVTLLHNHSLWMMPNVYPGAVARKYDIPLVVAPRGTFSAYAFASGSIAKRAFWPLLQRPALAAVTCFHATGQAECADVRRMGYRQPVAVIPNGIDVPPYAQVADNRIRTLLYVGRLHPEKGIEYLLHAWAAVFPRFPDWQLRLVGPDIGSYSAKLKTLSEKLNLRRVLFAGPLYGTEKQQAYRDAELLALPSPSENFGVAVAEALAAGRPVITTTGTPWQALIREQAGWWVEVGVDPLVGALTDALGQSPSVLAQRGQRGREWMTREFSWQSVGLRMEQCYRWIVNGGHPPSFVALH